MFLQRGLVWLQDQLTTTARNFLLNVLAAGPIPKHVAFVMDGNRRYARMKHQAIQQGHSEGFVALRRMLEICLRLNIKCVSAYAFAIENFKRSEEEVAALMKLAEEKLVELCEHGDLLDEYGVRLNVVGHTNMLPESVQAAVRKAEDTTRHNKRAIFNLCMPYASRDEIATAIKSSVEVSLTQDYEISYITEKDIDSQLPIALGGSPPLDILIRTSGVKRLSDFMLWHCSENTQLQFSSTYWPDFGLFDFIPVILDYQRKSIMKGSSI
ncbi:Di-trans-poly-cis-decaprenylcistransferase [Pholiota conissans]|uniref:Alkyl transferase n=1 Tax=Pholiota conissans TaxID=109636 RepID=A0A9P6D3A9_9AGAR|nr:Di-trans-poly-cis-decaprenylcistransferase [Pholiota conissans]